MSRHFFDMPDNNNGNVASSVPEASGYSGGSGFWQAIADFLFGEFRAESQQSRNREDWEAVNEYNLPSNQYDRLIQAGVSPSAAIGSITGQNNNASMVSPTSQSVPQSTVVDALLGNAHLDIDRNLALAELDKKRAEADMYDSVTNRNKTLTPKEAAKLDSEIDHIVSLQELDESQRRQIDYFTERAKRFEKKDLEKLQAEIQHLKEMSTNLAWDSYYQKVYGDDMRQAQINQQNASAYNLSEQGDLSRQNRENAIVEGEILKCKQAEAEFDKFYLEAFGAKPDADVKKQFFTAYNVDRYNKEDRKDAAPLRMLNAVEYYLDSGLNMLNEVGSNHKPLRNYLIMKEGSHFLQDWIDSESNFLRAVGSFKQ